MQARITSSIVATSKTRAVDVAVHFDGAAAKGYGAAGVVLHRAGKPVLASGTVLGRGFTCNAAEWIACIKALEAARDAGAHRVRVHGDSQLVIRQVTGRYKVKAQHLLPYHEQAQKLIGEFPGGVTFRWHRRGRNVEADALAERAIARLVGGCE
jgi:ribonuclease HI